MHSGVRMDYLSSLPEDCKSEILTLTTPRDACRSSAILRRLKSATDSDTVWERFLPSDYRQIISRSSFALDKETGKKCFTLPARKLNIAWKNGPQHWQWITLPESRFWKVARVHGVCWLEIWGNMKTRILSPKNTYATFLIFKIMEKFSGLESVPMKVSVRFVGEMEVGNGKRRLRQHCVFEISIG
ncbi:putative F-box protein PP2-B12 [Camellia lanceoleosa]|uniref:F-box protein PP2-B12 n=1 Tax=Camellia lanceoleosa TaxID=1840588 RepID=A0ACC0GXG8_9ERIC|nr:putative F-box protein PP2-B12 [Camellia lanceoleosa]